MKWSSWQAGSYTSIAWYGVWAMVSMKPPWPPPTRCASSRPCETGRRWIRQQLCTWYFNWHINDFGDKSYAESHEGSYTGSYEQYELDHFGSASGNHDGSGPAAGVRAAEPTTGCSDPARTDGCSAERRSVRSGSVRSVSVPSGSGKPGAADHDGSGCRPRDRARERFD